MCDRLSIQGSSESPIYISDLPLKASLKIDQGKRVKRVKFLTHKFPSCFYLAKYRECTFSPWWNVSLSEYHDAESDSSQKEEVDGARKAFLWDAKITYIIKVIIDRKINQEEKSSLIGRYWKMGFIITCLHSNIFWGIGFRERQTPKQNIVEKRKWIVPKFGYQKYHYV